MRNDLTSALIDHDEAALRARQLWRQGGVEAVQAAGFLVGWRGWLVRPDPDEDAPPFLASISFWLFTWRNLWVRAEDKRPRYGSGPGIHALTIGLQGWQKNHRNNSQAPTRRFTRAESAQTLGFVAGWGETWPHTHGFRCRYAVILALHEHESGLWTRFHRWPEISFTDFGYDGPAAIPGVPAITATRFVAETRRIRAAKT